MTYTRTVEGKTDTMIEVAPGEFVNTVSAAKLGMMRKPIVDAKEVLR